MAKQDRVQTGLDNDIDIMLNKCLSYERFLEKAKNMMAENALKDSIAAFQEGRNFFDEALKRYWAISRKTPLIAAFLDWIKEKRSSDLMLERSEILLENSLIQFSNDMKNPIMLSDLTLKGLSLQIEEIRCQKKYSITEREQLVDAFLDFFRWLSIHTFSCTPVLQDPDKERVKERSLNHDVFVSLLDALDARCCIIAKLLYFGGNRTLEEAVKLHVGDVDFKNHRINMQGELVAYPLHLFYDLKLLIGKRASGAVFLGRNNTSINPSTMFRKFKEVGSLLGLPELSPKSLISNR
jgi:integrase